MQPENTGPNNEQDINDVFDDIFLIENRTFEQSFTKGHDQGKQEENIEAYHLGYHRGAEVGAEIGYYTAVTNSYLKYTQENKTAGDDKLTKELTSLKQMLADFPHENNLHVDIIDLLSQIRAKFKKVCAILKIQPSFPEPNQLSF